ncbi:hypothetical protein J4732_14675 [Serratia marcescens]|uniref:ABC transmembrane type-1 domain-containing protein n=1 Tax=Serratia marcescens TaxID=615 RepID=A0A939NPB1_SERMA|nr:hypothetical protein [Serratia marcescens]
MGLFSGLRDRGAGVAAGQPAARPDHRAYPTRTADPFVYLAGRCVQLRALLSWLRERIGFLCGQVIRQRMRQQVLDKLRQLGPASIRANRRAAGPASSSSRSRICRTITALSAADVSGGFIPLLILIAVFPINWAAGIILLATAPLIPLFMALVGMGAADANRRNLALARLSGNFLDRLRGSTPCGCSTARRPKPRRSPNPPKTSAAAPWKCCARLSLPACWSSSPRSPSPWWRCTSAFPTSANSTSAATASA